MAALDWLREKTPEGSWVLANVRSTATFGTLAERTSLTEGDTPYTYPERLTLALSVLDASQRWFREPNLAYLEDNGIDYVVVSRRRHHGIGGNVYSPVPALRTLDTQPFLVRELTTKNVAIYSVQR